MFEISIFHSTVLAETISDPKLSARKVWRRAFVALRRRAAELGLDGAPTMYRTMNNGGVSIDTAIPRTAPPYMPGVRMISTYACCTKLRSVAARGLPA